MLNVLVLLAPLLLGACTQSHTLAMPKGAVFGLNSTHWIPAPGDLAPTQGTGR